MKLYEAISQFSGLHVANSTFTEYGWKCYGARCFFYDLRDEVTNFDVSFVFNENTFEIMEITVVDPYRTAELEDIGRPEFDCCACWVHPEFLQSYLKEEMDRLGHHAFDPFRVLSLEEVLEKTKQRLDAARLTDAKEKLNIACEGN